jgi:hypothetical protein
MVSLHADNAARGETKADAEKPLLVEFSELPAARNDKFPTGGLIRTACGERQVQ